MAKILKYELKESEIKFAEMKLTELFEELKMIPHPDFGETVTEKSYSFDFIDDVGRRILRGPLSQKEAIDEFMRIAEDKRIAIYERKSTVTRIK